MKRAFPQKVKPISYKPSTLDAVEGQSKFTPLGATRKARTSAAMIGLAISMGASSLILPRQSDEASAAEPASSESAVTVAPQMQQATAVLPTEMATAFSPTPAAPVVEHIVQEGQTLWRLARLYRVSIQSIVAANDLSADSVLRVGQILKIPASTSVGLSGTSGEAPSSNQSTSVSDRLSDASDSTGTKQTNSLSRLRAETEKLRDRLAELRSEELSANGVNSPKYQDSHVGYQANTPAKPSGQSSELPSLQPIAHKVKPGETLGAIASVYGVPQRELVAANHLTNPNWLHVNQSLVIPNVQSLPAPSNGSISTPLSVSTPLDSSKVTVPVTPIERPQVGGVQPETTLPSFSAIHRVHAGDTLAEIASQYRVPQAVLVAANHLQDPNFILVGQLLRVPPAQVATSHPSTEVGTATRLAAATSADSSNGAVTSKADSPLTTSEVPSATVTEAAVVTEPTVPTATPTATVQPTGAESTVSPVSSVSTLPQQVAVAPFAVAPHMSTPSNSLPELENGSTPNPYVQNLLVEINNLRDRYRSQSGVSRNQSQAPAVAAVPETFAPSSNAQMRGSAVNPEFNPNRYSVPEVVPTRPSNSQVNSAPSLAESGSAESNSAPRSASASRPAIVAVAPLGAENYAPLIQPGTGRLVSPELPPLPGSEQFLPNDSINSRGFIWPARGVLTSGYGWRWGRMHRGIDIAAPIGTPVHAAASGVIAYAGWNSGGYGNMVEVRHADGTMTRYAHLSRTLVRVGQEVDQGQLIAEIGSTGYSTGPHLHFEVHLPNQGTVNPIAYLPR